MARLPPETFRLPVERMREGYYTDQYFNLTRDLLEFEGHRPRVRMQVFQKQEAILGGIDEAIAVLKQCSGRHVDGGWEDGWDELQVRALREGDEVAPFEPVPTSSTWSSGPGASSSLMRATTSGWEIVCPHPMPSARLS